MGDVERCHKVTSRHRTKYGNLMKWNHCSILWDSHLRNLLRSALIYHHSFLRSVVLLMAMAVCSVNKKSWWRIIPFYLLICEQSGRTPGRQRWAYLLPRNWRYGTARTPGLNYCRYCLSSYELDTLESACQDSLHCYVPELSLDCWWRITDSRTTRIHNTPACE